MPYNENQLFRFGFSHSRKVRLKEFKTVLLKAFKATRSQSIAIPELLMHINKSQTEAFEEEEVKKLLGRMQDDNQVMLSEGVVFLI